ncbi:hypothetical protein WJX79_006947 [Trebouxia sp. C0005]
MFFARVGPLVSGVSGTVIGTLGAVAFGVAAVNIGVGAITVGCGILAVQKAYDNARPRKQESSVPKYPNSLHITADSSVASDNTTTMDSIDEERHQASLALEQIPTCNQVSQSEHQSKWLKPYFAQLITFWSPYTISPTSLKAPLYRQKLALVKQHALADKYDLISLSFARFVCEQKNLPYSGLACFAVMDSGEFNKLEPPL